MGLSTDAIIFGLAYLNGPRCKLSFGGEGAVMEITPRARGALIELLFAGYAEATKADDQTLGRENYRGTLADPHLGALAKEAGIDPLNVERWPSFVKRDAATAQAGEG